jgi:hypothetical protein
MKRYNHDGIPMPMIESTTGYWVTYEDYERLSLDYNKVIDRNWQNSNDIHLRTSQANEELLEKKNHIIIVLSTILFGCIAALLFMWR